jgi:bacterioferritin (cytochrome b1)
MKTSGAKSAKIDEVGNRTGMLISPEMAQEMVDTSESAEPTPGQIEDLADYRAPYIEEGFPVGSLPTPPTAEGEDQTGMAVLLDKLSERLAFERTGTRLYEALINKCEVLGEDATGPTLAELEEIGAEELNHFLMLNSVIAELGGDPTVQSPSADVASVASLGIVQVLNDPRTTVTQCLQAILTAELTDNDGWSMLIDLAENLGFPEMSEQFKEALEREETHLENVRTWLSARVMEEAEE